MKLNVDPLTDPAGWVVNAPSTIAENGWPDKIAGLNDKSLIIKFDALDSVRTATKTLPQAMDVSDYESLVFSIWSREFGVSSNYLKRSEYNYSLKLNDTQEFGVQVYPGFNCVTIGIEDVTSIDRIEFRAIHQVEDYIIISEMVAEQEEILYDSLAALKEGLEYEINKKYGDGILLQSGLSISAGSENITLPGSLEYLNKYAVIKIKEGGQEESHILGDNDGETFSLLTGYDGDTIQNTYTAADLYLVFPVRINASQDEINLPGVVLWGIEPEEVPREGKIVTLYDTYDITNDKFKCRGEWQVQLITMVCWVVAHNYDLLAKMAGIIRQFIARENLWINGRRHDVNSGGVPVEQRPTTGIEFLPKISYTMTVEVKENISPRVDIVPATDINTEITVVESL